MCIPFQHCDGESIEFLVQSHEILSQWKVSGNAGLTKETSLACLQSIGCMIELVKYMHTTHNFAYALPGKYMLNPIEGRFGWYTQANGGNFFMSIKQLLLAEKNFYGT